MQIWWGGKYIELKKKLGFMEEECLGWRLGCFEKVT